MPNNIEKGCNELDKRKNLPSCSSSSILTKYPDVESFCAAYHPSKIASVAVVPERAIMGDSPALSELKRDYGKGGVSWLIRLISGWQEQMPVKVKMPAMQIYFLAETIDRKYYYLKASEIMLFFGRLMGGAYGVSWYGTISPDAILESLDKFLQERDNVIFMSEMNKPVEKSTGITWEEYCKRKGIEKKSPIEGLFYGNKNMQSVRSGTPDGEVHQDEVRDDGHMQRLPCEEDGRNEESEQEQG